ncbi:hypothetical protein [Pseudomonas protegens]|uniref:hypothetical protein n=1 Tax=Pseudomonas protegens TaxID=380021 RepID=UPI00223EB5C6|nr:hypothetical protein [Pseudomonas protegens]
MDFLIVDFFSSSIPKVFTLCLIAFVILLAPLVLSKVAKQIPPAQVALYRKLALDTYVQTVLLLVPALIAAVRSYSKGSLTESITSAFLLISLMGGIGSLWSIWRAHGEIRFARTLSTSARRLLRLDEVTQVAKSVTVSAIIAVVFGGFGLLYVQLTNTPPVWFWFLAFSVTMYPVLARAWSINVLVVASRYASDPNLGV